MSLIHIQDLTFTYPGASTPILRNFSLDVEAGDFLAVVGNNGCGKSTLCKTLNGLIPHFIAGDFSGTVLVDGENTLDMDVGTLARRVGYVYQDFENQIVRPTVLDDASYACLNYGMEDYLDRGKKALELSGLSGREKDYIWQLSGGQTHLLALAGALALGPDVLILDEPIAQLDPAHADRIYQILRDLNQKQGKTIIVIEHHTEYIADYCRHVLLMKDGRAVWKLPVREALGRVEELEESSIFPPQVTIAASRLQKQGRYLPCAPLPVTVSEGTRAFQKLSWKTQPAPEKAKAEPPRPVASFFNVSASYRSVKGEPHKVFEDLNLTLRSGENIALVGTNGAGKSTLMKLLTGLIRPGSGSISLGGRLISEASPEEISQTVSLVYQNPEDMFIKDIIKNDIAYAMQARKIPDWEEKTRLLLKRFRLTDLANRDGRLLSGGQMRRASLAIGVALNPKILLLDEPTANLDIATRKEIMYTLKEMKDITETVMIATHDMQLVCEWADRILVLHQGRVAADGTRDEIFADRRLLDLVGIRPPEIFALGRALDERALCYTVDDFLNAFKETRDE